MSTNIPEHLVTPRDWQAEALAFSARELGTPEGRRALVESNRYGALADQVEALRRERDALAARMAEIEQAAPVAFMRYSVHDRMKPASVDLIDRRSVLHDDGEWRYDTGLLGEEWGGNEPLYAHPAPAAKPADGCGACGDSCRSRGSCRLQTKRDT